MKNSAILDVLASTNEGRKPSTLGRKYALMATGAFPFYRGANDLFARDWDALQPIDPGPPILLCGDLHLENFGAYLIDSGEARFGINDFDEAIVAPAALDLVRCSASIWLAADAWRIGPTAASSMVIAFLDRYRDLMSRALGSGRPDGGPEPEMTPTALRELLTPTALASRDEVLDRLTIREKSGPCPMILTGNGRDRLGSKKLEVIREAFAALGPRSESDRSTVVLDATTRAAGLGSLGLRRYLVLVEGGARRRLLDVKEAAPSALLCCRNTGRPAWATDEVSRVIGAEVRINDRPESGLGSIAFGGRNYRVRDMIPKANRASLSRLRRDPDRLRKAVRAAGSVAARAHLRGAGAIDPGRAGELVRWALGPSFDSVMVAAARVAERTGDHFRFFRRQIRRKSVRRRLGLPPGAPSARAD